MDLLETIGVMPGDLRDFRGRLDMRTGLGSSWRFDSLKAQACRPYNWGYFGEGATEESDPASRHRDGCP